MKAMWPEAQLAPEGHWDESALKRMEGIDMSGTKLVLDPFHDKFPFSPDLLLTTKDADGLEIDR